jgi:mannose-6-phosphate isomerase-like protein (cupin superfamily)
MSPAATVVSADDCAVRATAAGAVVRTLMDAPGSGGRLIRHQVEVPAGAAYEGTAVPGGELWFVLSGRGQLSGHGQLSAQGQSAGQGQSAAGRAAGLAVGAEHGLRLPGGASYRLAAEQDGLRLDVVQLPGGAAAPAVPAADAATQQNAGPAVVALAECAAEMTGDRRFRVLFGPGQGCAEATQFVGDIPPGRAPEHSHTYDEVVLILAGHGVVHLPGGAQPVAPGCCVHLPPGTPHCLENTGVDTLMVLGVFHPGGSPAAKRVSASGAS